MEEKLVERNLLNQTEQCCLKFVITVILNKYEDILVQLVV